MWWTSRLSAYLPSFAKNRPNTTTASTLDTCSDSSDTMKMLNTAATTPVISTSGSLSATKARGAQHTRELRVGADTTTPKARTHEVQEKVSHPGAQETERGAAERQLYKGNDDTAYTLIMARCHVLENQEQHERGAIIEQGLALDEGCELLRGAQRLQHSHHRHRVRGRQDGSKQETHIPTPVVAPGKRRTTRMSAGVATMSTKSAYVKNRRT